MANAMDEMQKVLLHEQQKNGKILMQVGLLILLSFVSSA
jgi:hypothetical protein